MTRRRGEGWSVAAAELSAVVAALALSGCVTDGKEPPPQPRALPEQPAAIRADRLVRTVGIPEDSDRNGLSDLIPVTVYMFNDQYVPPLALAGRFTFRLTDAGGERELARWEYDEAASDHARRTFMVGPGYAFRLSVLDVRQAEPGAPADRLPTREPLLFITFTPTDGPPVAPRTGTTVFMGGGR